jgi:4a-hydroxytetrahydrobiopterin dehydratase
MVGQGIGVDHYGWYMPLLADDEVQAFVDDHPDWVLAGNEITRTFEFSDFSESIGFVSRVAMEAEKANHHPDIDIRWNKVTLTLSTHSEGGLTEKDTELASTADGLA